MYKTAKLILGFEVPMSTFGQKLHFDVYDSLSSNFNVDFELPSDYLANFYKEKLIGYFIVGFTYFLCALFLLVYSILIQNFSNVT